jgi:hypothetical protein
VGVIAAIGMAGAARAGQVDGRIVLPANFQAAVEDSKAYWRVENGVVPVQRTIRDPRGVMVVVLEGAEIRPTPPVIHPTMVLREAGLWPAVLPVAVGTTVDFKNEGGMLHALFARGAEGGNFKAHPLPPGSQRGHTFRTPGAHEIRCAEVAHIRAVVLALDTPLFSAVDQAGQFKVAGVPPGRYSLRVWYAGSYVHGQPIDVPPEGPVSVAVHLLPR